jgi:hypothetical protein
MLSNLPPGVSDNDPHFNPPDDDEPEMKTPFQIRQRIKFLHTLLRSGSSFRGSKTTIQTEIETLQWVLGKNQ